MKKLIVNKKYDNYNVVTFLQKSFEHLNTSNIFKALRKKDIIVNGVRIKENILLHEKDEITIYIDDKYLYPTLDFPVIYEDDNILVLNKPASIEVVSDNINKQTMTTILKTKYDFIYPCHRLDRNTTGLILFAKNEEALNILFDKFKQNEIGKYYRCIVYGVPKEKSATKTAYLFKDNSKSMVYISDDPKKGYQKIITSYKTLDIDKANNISTLEVELHTGKTHQIRAHLAHIGLPILGDGKYGIQKINKQFNKKNQCLESYKLIFNFKKDSGILNYLSGMEIKIK